jgi:uncharacterized protein YjdB
MKKSHVLSILAALFLAAVLALAACETFEGEDGFVAVTNITVTPTTVTVGDTKPLEATVLPANATNKTIIWTVNGTEANLNPTNNSITGIKAGKVTLTATIINGKDNGKTNYTQDNLVITIFEPVTNIFVSPEPIIGTVNTLLPLVATVIPPSATNKTITWSVSVGGNNAYFEGSNFTAMTAGNFTVTATITDGKAIGQNFTKTFPITISDQFVFMPVASITINSDTGVVDKSLELTGTVLPPTATNKTITWSVVNQNGTSASINGNTLIARVAGTVNAKATITNGTAIGQNYIHNFDITITAQFVAVTGITSAPTKGIVGVPLELSATVSPSTATNKTIRWVPTGTGIPNYELDGSFLTAKQAGTVKVRAIIDNGTDIGVSANQDFTIQISDFVPVKEIKDVPITGITYKSIDLSKAKVMPEDATNRNNITWIITDKGTTNAGSINSNNAFIASNKGTVTVKATIKNGLGLGTGEDYIEPFTITILSEVEDIIQELGASAWAYEDKGKLILPDGGPYNVKKDITIPNTIEVIVTGDDITLSIDSGRKITIEGQLVISGDSTLKVAGGGTLNLKDDATVYRLGKLDVVNAKVNISDELDVQGELSIGVNGSMYVLDGGRLTISNGPEDEWEPNKDNKGKISGSGILEVQGGGIMRVPEPFINEFFSLNEIKGGKVLVHAGGDFHLLGYNPAPYPDFPNVEYPLIGKDIDNTARKTWRGAEYDVEEGFIEITFNDGMPALTLKGKANALGVRNYIDSTPPAFTREEMKQQLVFTIYARSVLTIGQPSPSAATKLTVTAFGKLINNGLIFINKGSKLVAEDSSSVKGTSTIFTAAGAFIPSDPSSGKPTWTW